MWTFSPFANSSMVSNRGIRPLDTMSDTVDFGTPVRIDTWRIVKFFLSISSSSNIFIH